MLILILINCPTAEIADQIAEQLVEHRLVAATNRQSEIYSRYVWKGEVVTAAEVPLIAKTRADLFDPVADMVRDLHPYETPAIIATAMTAANAEYVDWVHDVTVAIGSGPERRFRHSRREAVIRCVRVSNLKISKNQTFDFCGRLDFSAVLQTPFDQNNYSASAGGHATGRNDLGKMLKRLPR
ncbi:MAG: divalent-cation tolerance protein CutA, partial [Pseudomonadota bacterium]